MEYLTLNASCNNNEINTRINAKATYQGKLNSGLHYRKRLPSHGKLTIFSHFTNITYKYI